MKTRYKLNLPTYVDAKYLALYYSRLSYTYHSIKPKQIDNCFVSNSGLIIKGFFLLFGSAENLIGLEDTTFYISHWRKAIEQKIICKFGKSLKSIRLDDENFYFSIHTPWFGYFSWITTCLPRLFSAMEKYPNAFLIYPEEWDKIDYVKDSLALINGLKIKRVPADHHLFVKHYLLIPSRSWTSHFDKNNLLSVRDFFQKFTSSIPPYRKIYISRKSAKLRRITNELEIIALFSEFEIEVVEMEKLSYLEQIRLMSETTLLIGPHGAGLTNIQFLKSNSAVIEFTPILEDFKNFRYPYWRMASLLDINYFSIFCSLTSINDKNYDSDICVDELELKKILTLIFTQ